MIFEWDQKKENANIRNHGLSFSVAKFVFNDPERWERFDTAHSQGEERWQTLGLVDQVLFVVYMEQGEVIRLISARIADEDERRIYNGERDPGSWRKAN
jgi:uncharacterized DUF497 family protein